MNEVSTKLIEELATRIEVLAAQFGTTVEHLWGCQVCGGKKARVWGFEMM